MRRAVLFVAWLATTVVAGYVTTLIVQAYGPVPRPLVIAVGNLPAALLLAALARDRVWSPILGAGWLVVALLQFAAVDPLLSASVHRLAPTPDLRHNPPTVPPRSAYLTVWLVLYTLSGLVHGLLGAALLWWYLRSPRLWVALMAIGGGANALSVYWLWLLPMPGFPNAGFLFLGPVITAAAFAALWRWDARGPDLPAAFLWGRSPTPAPAGSAAPPAPDARPR